jgi:hypothetical protein
VREKVWGERRGGEKKKKGERKKFGEVNRRLRVENNLAHSFLDESVAYS